MYNAGDDKQGHTFGFEFSQLNGTQWNQDTKVQIRDLWQQKDLGVFTTNYSALVDMHGVKMLKLTQVGS